MFHERRAFTMIELLLVLVIIGIITAITVPSLVRSIRGNRLSTSARSVIMAGRYARSMAVMKQTEMALVLNMDNGTVSVRVMPVDLFMRIIESRAEEPRKPEEDEVEKLPDETDEDGKVKPKPEPRTSVSEGTEELSRKLERVTISRVTISETKETFSKGTCQILYRSNGTCEPYEVEITDDNENRVKIEVDSLSSARTETES